jgi:tetratricopeptide (TPR) repeat protein
MLKSALAIPATLQASLLAPLDRLAPAREVAQIGATLGRRFSHELIAAVAVPGSGPGMPPPLLDDALAQLVGAELIYRRGTAPDAEYMFKHALVQDAAYGTLLRSRRQQLHARIAATLEGQFPEIVATQPAFLAHHCEEGGLSEKAIAYWLAAGRQAWARSMLAEAVALLRRGLTLVPGLRDGDWRRDRELDLRIALGQALKMSRSWGAPELAEVHFRARELALTLNRPRALLFALWGQVTDHWARADLTGARRLAAEMRELGDTAGDVPMQVAGCGASGLICFHLGDFTAGRAYLEKGLAPFYAEVLTYDALVSLRLHLARQLASLGHLDQALFQTDAALEEARRLSHPPTLAFALASAWLGGTLARFEPASLLRHADELLAFATEHGLGFYLSLALCQRGWSLAALERADEGIPLLITGIAGWHELGFIIRRSWVLTLLGDSCRMAGEWQAALEHLAEARRRAEETGDRCYQAETLRLGGDVLPAMGDRTGAEASYREALGIAQRQSAKLWELRAATSLARLWRDQGKRPEARDLLAPVYNWFTEGFATPVLQDTKALLEELAA